MASAPQTKPGIRDALIVVDVQNDFCPGGRLAVQKGDEVVPLVNAFAGRFENVVLTQDWHPPGHRSFATSHPGSKPFDSVKLAYGVQVLWPDHCVQGSALDARKLGFAALVVEDACRAIDMQGSLAAAWEKMKKAGVKRIQSDDIA